MTLSAYIAFAASLGCFGLAVVALWGHFRSLARWTFALGMAAFAAESCFVGLSVLSASELELAGWQSLRMRAIAVLPGVWLAFSLCFSRGNYRAFLYSWRYFLAVVGVVPLALVVAFPQHIVVESFAVNPAGGFLSLGWVGIGVNVFLLVSSVLILINLERTFRASTGTMRWRIKFMMLGLGVIFAVRIYSSSQAILYQAVNVSLSAFNSAAKLIAVALILRSQFRRGVFELDLYPSEKFAYGTTTAVLAGLYFVMVGGLAKIVEAVGGDPAFPLKAFILLLSLAVVAVALMSDRVQQQVRVFVSRHLRRSLYNYQQIWTSVTQRTLSIMDARELCRAMADFVSNTFHALSVNLWLFDGATGQLILGASTSLLPAAAKDLESRKRDTAALKAALLERAQPFNLEKVHGPLETVKELSPGDFVTGGQRLGLPLIANREVLGVVTLADRVNGVPFRAEELELLKYIADHISTNLLRIELSQKLLQAKEMEAFQTMSAFFVHDLKNTASSLSLMLQNLRTHFEQPAFREDALRAVSKSVSHLDEIINRLSQLRQGLEMKPKETDLNALVNATLAALNGTGVPLLVPELQTVPKIEMDPEQIQKVITNLVLNAKEAIGTTGEIRLRTSHVNGWVVLAVEDNGCGMSPEFVSRSLFRPFQTTKKTGIGIGMFHSKMIVERHQGRIEVESEPGKGTAFRVFLPCGKD